MSSNQIITIIVLVLLLIIILRSKPYKVWWRGRNKTNDQKKAIKFLIYGPSRSKITENEYDTICYRMYTNSILLEKAKTNNYFKNSPHYYIIGAIFHE